ncbi:MAG: FKBP-type peptidyl-prolyl cis-trans isomerase [Planctomycetes bacterium]|nr:FKBP-type peptidyl-prolyl cis-trans isomerase [Planctomycetota bacterium]MCB9872293.1 FKBP-type peptidyl-prolyl cis-trans isomerase [Planctomycetota bacterium]
MHALLHAVARPGSMPCFAVLLLAVTLPAQTQEIPKDGATVERHQSGVQYSVLAKGKGEARAALGDDALVRFAEWLNDGTLVDSTKQRGGQPLRFRIGDPRVPLGLNLGVQLVGRGGRVKLTVPPELAYGKTGQMPRVPPNATMVYEIELVEFVYRPKQPKFIQGDPQKTKVTDSGLKYQVLTEGAGTKPSGRDIVEIEFSIWDVTGKPLGGTYAVGQTATAPIPELSHPFFKELMPMMQPGAVWRLVVPKEQTVQQIDQDTVWQVKMIRWEVAPVMPPRDDEKSTSTKSGLYYQRLREGKGGPPATGWVCELAWSFWRESGSFVAGTKLQGQMKTIVGQSPHKFLDEIIQRMQLGEVMRVEVPQDQTIPKMIPFKTVWQLELLSRKAPLPTPKFELPPDSELTKTASGLRYKVLTRGPADGKPPQNGGQVTVHYAGWLTDGTLFDSSYARVDPVPMQLGGVLPGWTEGLQLMRPGDTFLFVIPPKLAYGARGAGDKIPPDATLVFHISLLRHGQ